MYVMAAVALLLGSLFVVLMMFLPARGEATNEAVAYIPGSLPSFSSLGGKFPSTETIGITEIGPKRYRVVMAAYNWQIAPDVIRVPVGSEITFRARSVDDYHGIKINGTNIMMSLTKNDVIEKTHTFTEPGEYIFQCYEYCGSGHGNMVGKIIVQ
jgi:heme/copper-type cytochrome/quinol oxidase subunit 2